MIYYSVYYDQNGSTRAYLWAEVIITQQEKSFAISLMASSLNLNSNNHSFLCSYPMRAYIIEIQKQNLPIFIFVKTAIQSQATKLDSMYTFIL
mgnify:CR=1 FL=1